MIDDPLTAFIKRNKLDPIKVMNDLQDEGGIISDLCVMPEDVWLDDCDKAIRFLKNNKTT